MTSFFNLPRLDLANHRWSISPVDKFAQRIAVGTEQWVGIKHENARGQYDNYLSTTLSLSSPNLSLQDVHQYVTSALIHVRYQHPEVAATAVWEADKNTPPTILYTPFSVLEVQTWVMNTVSMRTGPQDGHALRTEQERMRACNPENGSSISIILSADVSTVHTPMPLGSRIIILCRFNHIFWDAMSSRQFVGDLLRKIASAWVNKEEPAEVAGLYMWGEETQNLAEPLLDALKIDVNNLGQDYVTAADEFIAGLMKSNSSWGLDVKNMVGTPRTDFVSFSAAESSTMIEAVKSRLGPLYTISHLGHIAMVLSLLKLQPLPAETHDQIHLCSPLPVNGRRYLKSPNKTRYGSCQAGAIVQFSNLQSWIVDEDDSDAVKRILDRGCRHVKDGYDYWLSKEFQVAVNACKDHFLAAYLNSLQQLTHCEQYDTDSKEFKHSIFASDGIVDHYVPSVIKYPEGKELLAVESCLFLLDTYGSDMLIRMDSFKGATSLSISYNDGFVDKETARKMLSYVAKFMLAII